MEVAHIPNIGGADSEGTVVCANCLSRHDSALFPDIWAKYRL